MHKGGSSADRAEAKSHLMRYVIESKGEEEVL